MGKTIVYCALKMSAMIIVLYSCMVIKCMCSCTGVSKNSRLSNVSVHKQSSLVWLDPIVAQGIYHLQYKPSQGTHYGSYTV